MVMTFQSEFKSVVILVTFNKVQCTIAHLIMRCSQITFSSYSKLLYMYSANQQLCVYTVITRRINLVGYNTYGMLAYRYSLGFLVYNN